MNLRLLRLLLETRGAAKADAAAIAERQRARLADQVSRARTASPYYRTLYRDLPTRVSDPTLLPVTTKQALMARFDDWVTDPAITIGQVRALVDDPSRIGEPFLGKYTVATTSGTAGVRGIFVMDARSLGVTTALAGRMVGAWLRPRDVLTLIVRGGRLALVSATGGHFASAVAATRLQRRRGDRVRVFPVQTPLPELVAQLNRFRPALLAPYASMGALLASEQEAGRLHINPVLVVLAAEGLAASEYTRIATAFKATVGDSYAATECPFLSYRRAEGWLHVNSDWVVLEPVDADYRPVRPGERSHTVLISNLANRVQPILRYDLGDRVIERPDPCPCGNPMLAIRVEGRTADVLAFLADGDQEVSLAPLALAGVLDRIPGIELFQLVQTMPTSLRLRLRPLAGAKSDHVWQMAEDELREVLTVHNLAHVRLERASELPVASTGGKYRRTVPLSGDARPRRVSA